MRWAPADPASNCAGCPDVGGPHAYFDFLAAIRDPIHEEHRTLLEWIGGSFDPVAFSIDDINERLSFIKA
jgi:Plasmid pRiA4b ORF-3-like protein